MKILISCSSIFVNKEHGHCTDSESVSRDGEWSPGRCRESSRGAGERQADGGGEVGTGVGCTSHPLFLPFRQLFGSHISSGYVTTFTKFQTRWQL